MTASRFLVIAFLPIIAAGVANAVQCKVQGETEIARCAIAGLLAGAVTVMFYFVGVMILGE